ncbi:CRTAC1 family protein [Candidatus Poribacteria bacterium]|jgi:enediyne biosynthesis protein E4|nr:CRTAC1 family protein [Candidatus Poribacteria bacterium]
MDGKRRSAGLVAIVGLVAAGIVAGGYIAGCRGPDAEDTAADPDEGGLGVYRQRSAMETRVGSRSPYFDELQNLEARKKEQLAAGEAYGVAHDFSFTDRVTESGITAVHQIVDDAGRHWKPVHYDHGNGIAVADIDRDGLLDIYFLTQIGANELWRNRGDGTFEDVTAAAGVALEDRISVTASLGDTDNDGDSDLFVTTVRMGNVLYENLGDGRFRDISAESGLDYVGHSSGAVFFDYNLDGRLDLYLTNVGNYTTDERGRGGYYVGVENAFSGHLVPEKTETSILYENTGGNEFVDVSSRVELLDGGWSGDASFADLNGDLYPDLYVLNMQGDDHYYENDGGRRFVEKTEQLFPKTSWGAMGIKFFDYDIDGRMDLMITDMHSDMSENVGPDMETVKNMVWDDDVLQGGDNNVFGNSFHRNVGVDLPFEEISDEIGAENFWPWGLSVADINADGYEDVFITSSMNYPFRYGINSALLNDHGKQFLDAEFLLGIEPRLDSRIEKVWFELDCSGEDAGHPECGDQTGIVAVNGVVGSRASVIFDLDGDGDLDIVTSEFNDRPQVLVSSLAQLHDIHYLKVRLEGSRSNRDGLGATVKVHAGGMVYTRYADGKSGYLSQSAAPLYFGLGDATEIEKIEVLWPSGTEQVMSAAVPMNTDLVMREPTE